MTPCLCGHPPAYHTPDTGCIACGCPAWTERPNPTEGDRP
jgi:hypothetical protein